MLEKRSVFPIGASFDSDERDVAATFRRGLSEADLEESEGSPITVIDFPTMAAHR